jgi:fused signal recognition particle receptor
MFNFIKEKIKNVYEAVTGKMAGIFSREHIDESFFKDLQSLLLEADTGVKATAAIMQDLSAQIRGKAHNGAHVRDLLAMLLEQRLEGVQKPFEIPSVVMMVGVNGSGKTTFVAKLAYQLKQQGKKVLLVAGDTFRAAATHQLREWGERAGIEVFVGREEQDPASVIFDACSHFIAGNFDHLIIDTAGRLQTKVNLMKELEKIRRVIDRQLPQQAIAVWLSIDAMLGQNSLQQASVFHEATRVDGLVLTKLDGTGKGGIVFALTDALHIPVLFVTYGEEITALKRFDGKEFVHGLLYE